MRATPVAPITGNEPLELEDLDLPHGGRSSPISEDSVVLCPQQSSWHGPLPLSMGLGDASPRALRLPGGSSRYPIIPGSAPAPTLPVSCSLPLHTGTEALGLPHMSLHRDLALLGGSPGAGGARSASPTASEPPASPGSGPEVPQLASLGELSHTLLRFYDRQYGRVLRMLRSMIWHVIAGWQLVWAAPVEWEGMTAPPVQGVLPQPRLFRRIMSTTTFSARQIPHCQHPTGRNCFRDGS